MKSEKKVSTGCEKPRQVLVRFDSAGWDQLLEAMAAEKAFNKSEFIRHAIAEYLTRHRPAKKQR